MSSFVTRQAEEMLTQQLIAKFEEMAGILRDIRPLLDGMRGEMPDGLGKQVMVTLLARIDRAMPADRGSET
jgi:hypothetical protein